MATAWPRLATNSPHLARDGLRLKGDDVELDADRVAGLEDLELARDLVAERDDVAAVAHGDAQRQGGGAGGEDPAGRRIDVAAGDLGQVFQEDGSPAGPAATPRFAADRRPTRSCRSARARCAPPRCGCRRP